MKESVPSVAVVTDSIADIPTAEVEALHISVVPAILTIEGRTYVDDGKEISRSEFYQRMPTMKEPPTTAIPSSLAFEKTYQRLMDSGFKRILSIHVSGRLSGMLNAANQAAQAFGDRIHIFDSGQASMGLGFQVMEAASAALAGMPFESVLETTRVAQENIRLIALIDTMEYLKRSGRVSWLRAELGDLLNIKLLIRVADGVVEKIGLIRTRRKGINQLLSLARSWGPLKRLAVLHSNIPDKAVEVTEQVRGLSSIPPLIIDVTTLLGTYVGPNGIGLAGLCK
jgi:DegV family protein with EDD domain